MSKYIKIGKLAASHGLKGDFVLEHNLGKKTALKDLRVLFVEQSKDNFMPYFIEKATARSENEVLLKLEGVNDKEAARKLTPRPVWFTEADFQLYKSKSAPITILGYHVIHEETDLGEILEVIEQPHQILCTLMFKGKEAMIPVHEQNLIKLDHKNKKVFVEIPEGLLDIYA
jgi:16S rRNA processing protein RimM